MGFFQTLFGCLMGEESVEPDYDEGRSLLCGAPPNLGAACMERGSPCQGISGGNVHATGPERQTSPPAERHFREVQLPFPSPTQAKDRQSGSWKGPKKAVGKKLSGYKDEGYTLVERTYDLESGDTAPLRIFFIQSAKRNGQRIDHDIEDVCIEVVSRQPTLAARSVTNMLVRHLYPDESEVTIDITLVERPVHTGSERTSLCLHRFQAKSVHVPAATPQWVVHLAARGGVPVK